MMLRKGFVAILAFLCAATKSFSGDLLIGGVPIPEDVRITQPAAAVSEKYKQFLGVWIGSWGDSRHHALIVDDIQASGNATVIYAVGDSTSANSAKGWWRYQARIVGDTLTISQSFTASYRIGSTIMDAVWRRGVGEEHAFMARMELSEFIRAGADINWLSNQKIVLVPRSGTAKGMVTRLCHSMREGPAPLAVINHGSPFDASKRPEMRPLACTSPVAKLLSSKGFVVALPLRRGYGGTGGSWAEHYGRCDQPDFVSAGRETADDILSAINHLRKLPNVMKDKTIVVGISAGGWGTIALASSKVEGVSSCVNFVGGRGGRQGGKPHNNCNPDSLVTAAGVFGKTAQHPVLWVYSENDTYFAPSLASRMHDAYVKSGGKARFVMLPPFGDDGHLIAGRWGGLETWREVVDRWLESPTFR
jgi:pimeloyl-ACP methyl ester carboxylesterase